MQHYQNGRRLALKQGISRLGDIALLAFIWAVCTVLLGLAARVMFDLFMLGFSAW